MPRSLSSTAIASQNAQETAEIWLVLLTISHTSLTVPIRVVNNNEDITSRTNVFTAFPFEIILPSQDPESVPKAMLRIDNVDRSIDNTIRSITSAPTITIEVILASAPDTVEISFPNLTLRNVNYDANLVEGDLYFENIFTEPVTYTMTPSRFPGLF